MPIYHAIIWRSDVDVAPTTLTLEAVTDRCAVAKIPFSADGIEIELWLKDRLIGLTVDGVWALASNHFAQSVESAICARAGPSG